MADSMRPFLQVGDLRIDAGDKPILKGVSFAVPKGELIGLVGESGSGKSTIGFACMGLIRTGTRLTGGAVMLTEEDVTRLSADHVRALRRHRVAYVPQSAGYALNPSMRIGTQLAERLPPELPAARREATLLAGLADVALPAERALLRRYPHELSGGQQQRVAIAAALLGNPEFVVFDEPTTGLDVQVQHHMLQLVAGLCAKRQMSGIFITHDLAAVAEICSGIVILRDGEVVEQGSTAAILAGARHAYTRELLAAVPSLRAATARRTAEARSDAPDAETQRGLEVSDLSIFHQRYRAVGPLSIRFARGQTTAIVGESGSGKTTLCRAIIGLHGRYQGAIRLDGEVLAQTARARPPAVRRRMQYVFQNPFDALNPRRTVERILREPAELLGIPTGPDFVAEQLEAVRVPASYAGRRPDQLSGGERQRVALARALGLRPDVLICDEVTSALDVSVQATVVSLIADLQRQLGLTVLFVTHHLGLVPQIARDVLVLRAGEIVSQGPTHEVFTDPGSDYTARLIELSPDLESYGYRPAQQGG